MEAQLVEMNQELIEYMQALIAYNAHNLMEACAPKSEPITEVRKYKPRDYVKSTEHERQRSREYYIANRELILEKRRIYNAKLKGRRYSKA